MPHHRHCAVVCLSLFLSVAGAAAAGPGRSPAVPARTPGGIDRWLAEHAKIRDRLAWVTGAGARQDYVNWTRAQKSRIEQFYNRLETGDRDLGMKLPDPEKAQGCYSSDVAFDIFAAHVAHVVYVEAHDLVPWKIENRPADELDELLNSTSYFSMIRPSSKSEPAGIAPLRDLQDTPENDGLQEYISDPRIGYEFLSGKTSTKQRSLIGKDELETLKNLTLWLRDNVDHATIDDQAGERAKKLRWLDERLRAFPGQKTAMANIGCHSATRLMVDLARSVNIPLLHVRALDATLGVQNIDYMSRTHGGLVYGWDGPNPRIVWHTDNIYAREGRICFPIDAKTGKLLPKAQADQLYFDEVWKTPAEWAKMGFDYNLIRVFPNQGYGHNSGGPTEDRDEFGMMSGHWTAMGRAHQDELLDWIEDYNLCGFPLINLAKNQIVQPQLTTDFQDERGNLKPTDAPRMPSLAEFDARATQGLKAIGGAARFDALTKTLEAQRGSDLLKPGVTYDGRKR